MKRCIRALTSTWILFALLAVTVGCASNRTVGEQADDSTITTKITAKLAADPEVNPFNIDVDTFDGEVTLRGEVEKEFAKTEAERLARDTRGVRSVRNEIAVVSPADKQGRPSDAWITTKVKSKITADPELNPFNIDVDTQGGRVTLSGEVKTRAARDEAEKLARNTRGVVAVVNELKVEA